MAATMEDRVGGMEKKLDDMLNKLTDAQSVVMPGRISRDGNSFSYWEMEPTAPSMKVHRGLQSGMQMMRANQFPEGYKPFGIWKSLSNYLADGVKAHYKDAGGNAGSIAEFATRYNSAYKAIQGMSTATGADGGFTVLPEFAPQIRDRVWDNDLFSRTDSYTVGGNRMTFPKSAETSRANGSRAGGIRAYWMGEGDPITASSPKLAETELKLKKLAVVVYLTQELIDDNAYALEQWVSRKVTEEFKFMLGLGVTRGTGGAQMTGYLNSLAKYKVAKDPNQGADTIIAKNILDMWSHRLAVGDQSQLAWFINQNCEPELCTLNILAGASGQLVYMPPGGLSQSPYATLMGKPVIPTEFNSVLGDEGDIALCNLKEYATITKGGITEASSIHVEFLTDQLAIRFIMRVDGRPYDDAPVTPYMSNGTDLQSAFITLETR